MALLSLSKKAVTRGGRMKKVAVLFTLAVLSGLACAWSDFGIDGNGPRWFWTSIILLMAMAALAIAEVSL